MQNIHRGLVMYVVSCFNSWLLFGISPYFIEFSVSPTWPIMESPISLLTKVESGEETMNVSVRGF